MNLGNKKTILLIIAILFLLVIIGSTSYAVGNWLFNGTNQTIATGKIEFVYGESNVLNIISDSTMDDSDGKLLNEYFAFDVSTKASGKITIGYYIYFTPNGSNTLDSDAVKLYLSKVNNSSDAIISETEIVSPTILSNFLPFSISTKSYDISSNKYFIYNNNFVFTGSNTQQTHYYRLRLWIDSNYNMTPTETNQDGSHSISTPAQSFKMTVSVYGHNGSSSAIVMP